MGSAQLNSFGGPWTVTKLEALRKYLVAYLTIMTTGTRAKSYDPVYVDAFAGSGAYLPKRGSVTDDANEATEFALGSARIALTLDRSFTRYVFVDTDEQKLSALRTFVESDTSLGRRVTYLVQDANDAIETFVRSQNWQRTRALVFLDPFGMQVRWTTIETLGRSGGTDLWLLYPAMAVQRMLPKKGVPSSANAHKLTEVLGSDVWRNWYKPSPQASLFSPEATMVKSISLEQIAETVKDSMRRSFKDVSHRHLVLKNSLGAPLFLLLFATNKGGKTALRIAGDVMRSLDRD